MKKLISILVCVIITGVIVLNLNNISDLIANFLDSDKKVSIPSSNEYKRNYEFKFVQMSKDYVPYSYQGLLNIIYSTLNNGWDTFTFYCPDEYTDCTNDLKNITSDKVLLSNINNFVHPFNSFQSINIITSTTGEITINVTKLYSDEDIKKINTGIDQIIKEKVPDNLDLKEKIQIIHDYIINNTKYDKNHTSDTSFTAIGPLFDGIAVCSGYADLMELFLEKFGLKSFKVASETHIWNAVLIDGSWKNLDLTWDDPITKDSDIDTLIHKFFLIDKKQLLEFDTKEHTFDATVYQELE